MKNHYVVIVPKHERDKKKYLNKLIREKEAYGHFFAGLSEDQAEYTVVFGEL